jgi:hypothetical protein
MEVGAVNAGDWERFVKSLETSDFHGTFFAYGNIILVVGTKARSHEEHA